VLAFRPHPPSGPAGGGRSRRVLRETDQSQPYCFPFPSNLPGNVRVRQEFPTAWERRFKAPPHAVEERPLSPGAVWRNRMGAPVTPLCG